MGFGDVKLTLGFGLLVGVYDGLMAIMLAFIVGAGVGILLLYAPEVIKRMSLSSTTSRFTMSSEIPFAPFLIIGFLLVYLFQIDLLALIGAFI
jgi:prepilin signal peptidase PulO-like enzyme (type II secretory pathway)